MDKLHLAIIDPVGIKAGLDHYDNSLAKALNKKFCITEVFSNYEGDIHSPFVKNHFKFKIENNILSIVKLLVEFNSAFKIAKKGNTDIVILHIFHFNFIDYLSVKLAKRYGFRVLLIIHDIESLLDNKSKSWLRSCLTISDYNVVHNQFAYDELFKKNEKLNRNKVFIIPHGNFIGLATDTDKNKTIDYFNLSAGKKYLLFFGMIKKTKGLENLLEAMKDIPVDVHLIVAGRLRDVSFQNYSEIIKKNNLSGRVHSFTRYISNEERNMLFNFSDIAILPYNRIYQSGVLLLAMSYGIPLVVSDLPANKSIIESNRGVLFKSGDASDLALKINLLFSDKSKMKFLSENAKMYVEKNHNWDKIGKDFIDILG